MRSITRRQGEVLDFLRTFVKDYGYPPTRRDITDEFGFKSPNAAEEHLRALDRKGFIDLKKNTSRGIILTHTVDGNQLPIIGRVAAGAPVMAEQNFERVSNVTGSMFNPYADYLLRVQGESMINAGIFDGDLIAVHRTAEALENQIVVARIEDEVTVKRYHHDLVNKEIHLIPENDEYSTIKVDENSGDFTLEGLCVGLLRMRI